MSFRFLEGLDHVLDDGGTGEDVALGRAVLAHLAASPLRGLRSGKCGGLTLQIDHRELTALLRPSIWNGIRIALPDCLDDRIWRHALLQQRDTFRAVAHVDD